MIDLDLDINHYEMQDLETFFRLVKPYNEHDVAQKEHDIRTLLLSSGHIEPHFKRDLIMFLEEGKKRLITHNITVKHPTTIHKTEPAVPDTFPVPNVKPPSRAENVIPPKHTEFSYQQTSEFFPGQLNPLDTRILKKCLTIDSRFCPQHELHTDFTVSLPSKIPKVVAMECVSLEILSQSLYNISASLGNSYIYVSIQTRQEEFNRVLVVPDGHYDTDLLLETLNRICDEQTNTPFPCLEWKKDPYGSGKCVLTVSLEEDPIYTESIERLCLDFTVNYMGEPDKSQESFTRLGYLLGFTKKTYAGCLCHMGEIPINTNSSLPYFYLSVDDYQNRSISVFQPAYSQITMQPSKLARISLNHQTNDVHLVSMPRKYFGPVDITRLHVQLFDPHGKQIRLNTNFSFCLQFDTVYDL